MANKRNNKKRKPQPSQQLVRLSQCMIVKNEEKNIETALGWAKGIAFEQIVVDTGSTDRTVEIAKKMGAKVFHFEWIDDFSAAKNYAIEQCKGNWIAFLDADEFFKPEDAKKLMTLLRQVQSDPKLRKKVNAINCPWAHVDDAGIPFAINDQERIFRNTPETRYVGKIHEQIALDEDTIARTTDFTIIHTGYSKASYAETGKLERNVAMLRQKLAEDPDDYNTKAYLADSLSGIGDEESCAEAESIYRDVIENGKDIFRTRRKKAYIFLLNRYTALPELPPECEELCRKALRELPGDIDIEAYLGFIHNKNGKYSEAWDILRGCEEKLTNSESINESMVFSANPEHIFAQLVIAAEGMRNVEGIVRYATMILTAEKDTPTALGGYIKTLLDNNVSEDEVFALLGKLYDYKNPQDLMLIARAAKDWGALGFAKRIAEIAMSGGG